MAVYFAEDAAHDAVLKALGKPKAEIEIRKGRARVIALTLERENAVGFIDHDNNVDTRLADVNWQKTDDFEHCRKDGKLFVKFKLNVEDWLYRIAKDFKVDVTAFKLPDTWEACHLNQKINASNHDARRFLKELFDAKDSPLKLLKQVIEQG